VDARLDELPDLSMMYFVFVNPEQAVFREKPQTE
jgi:hypothetical protein